MDNTKIEWADATTWGNRIVDSQGYVLVYCPYYPGAKPNGYVHEHRLVVAACLGRPLLPSEHIHHRNDNKQDNRIENLAIMSNAEHRKLHMASTSIELKRQWAEKGVNVYAQSIRQERKQVTCACGCGQNFTTPDAKGRIHKFVHGHNNRGVRRENMNGRQN